MKHDHDHDHDDHDDRACPACGSTLQKLGTLGNLVHYRCSGCGMDSSTDERPDRRAPGPDERPDRT